MVANAMNSGRGLLLMDFVLKDLSSFQFHPGFLSILYLTIFKVLFLLLIFALIDYSLLFVAHTYLSDSHFHPGFLEEISKNKDNGRYPTRAELFKKCYSKPDGTSEAIQEAITQMEELAAQNSENSNSNNGIHDPDDDFAKVMGKDKDGQLRLYGMGVKAGDVYGAKPSRDALFRQSMEYKEKYFQQVEKFEALNAKVEELIAIVQGKARPGEQSDAGSTRVASPRGQSNSRSPPLDNHISSPSISRPTRIKVGSCVLLKNGGDRNEVIAGGIVTKTSNVYVNGMELERDFCEIVIQFQVKRDARLLFPHSHFQTIGDALGVPIVWPLSMVELDEDED